MPRAPTPPRVAANCSDQRSICATSGSSPRPAFSRESLLRGLERRPAALLGPQMLRQLIATILTEQAVLPPIGLLGLLEDVGDQPS